MPFEQRDLSGALFKNDRRTKESQPHYRGNCKIDGTEYWVSGWIKTPQGGGDKYMSLAFTAKDQQGGGASTSFDDDDIPF